MAGASRLSDEERRQRAYAARQPATADERERRKARLKERAADPNAPLPRGARPGRVMSGVAGQAWYIDLRRDHPTDEECWPWERSRQVSACAAERKRHPDLPMVASVRPYLRTALLDEPYTPGLIAAPSCAMKSCVNPRHTVEATAAERYAAAQGITPGHNRKARTLYDEPLLFDYLLGLTDALWAVMRGAAEPWAMFDGMQYPHIPAVERRLNDAMLVGRATGLLSMDMMSIDPLTKARLWVKAGLMVNWEQVNEVRLAKVRDLLPVSVRVALGLPE